MKKTIRNHLIYIALSIVLSWSISMSADLVKLELGVIINIIYPIILGVLSITIYFIGSWIFKGSKGRLIFLIIAILLNLSTGLYIRFVDF